MKKLKNTLGLPILYSTIVGGFSYWIVSSYAKKVVDSAPENYDRTELEEEDQEAVVYAYKDLGFKSDKIKVKFQLDRGPLNHYSITTPWNPLKNNTVVLFNKPLIASQNFYPFPTAKFSKLKRPYYWYAIAGHEAVHAKEHHKEIQWFLGPFLATLTSLLAYKLFSLRRKSAATIWSSVLLMSMAGISYYFEKRADIVSAKALKTAEDLIDIIQGYQILEESKPSLSCLSLNFFVNLHPSSKNRIKYLRNMQEISTTISNFSDKGTLNE